MTQRTAPRAAAAAETPVTDAAPVSDALPVNDGFQNLQARLGVGAGNLSDASGYTLGAPITRRPRELEFMYRGSWIVGAAVDAIADDMTRAGVDFGSAIPPDVTQEVTGVIDDTQTWEGLGDVVRWARLYGGSLGVIMIDGQDVKTPLRPETIAPGSYRGIHALSRWELFQTTDQVVGTLGPDLGNPKFYQVAPTASAFVGKKIHHSRVIRMEGIKLPYYQRLAEQGWGLTIVERMFDRLLAFDSATTGAAQLVFKAYLRTLKVEGLKKILAAGGAAEEALAKNVEAIRKFQSTEGFTLVDAADTFETHQYTFAGLDDVLLQFGQQLSGATEIPLVRLFGQSPAGMNSTGESDIRNYYDAIAAKQKRTLRAPVTKLLDIIYRSATGEAPRKDFNYTFNPLWQLSEKEKAETAKTIGEAVGAAYDDGIITKPVALRELKQSADVTGVFSNISDQDITDAENEPPEVGELGDLGLTPPSVSGGIDALSA